MKAPRIFPKTFLEKRANFPFQSWQQQSVDAKASILSQSRAIKLVQSKLQAPPATKNKPFKLRISFFVVNTNPR